MRAKKPQYFNHRKLNLNLLHCFDFLDFSFVFSDQFLDVRFQSLNGDLFDFVRLLSNPLLAANLFGGFCYLFLFLYFDAVTEKKARRKFKNNSLRITPKYFS